MILGRFDSPLLEVWLIIPYLNGYIAFATHIVARGYVGIVTETEIAEGVRSWREVRRVVH